MDRLSKKLIEYGFSNGGHYVWLNKNGIDFSYGNGIFRIGNDFEQSTIKMKSINVLNIKKAIKAITDFTLTKA